MPSNPHRSGLPAIQKLKKLTAVLTLCFCGAVTQFASPQSQSTARPVPPTNPGGFRRPNPSNALPACGEELFQGSLGVRKVAVEEGPRPGAADPMAIPAGRYQLFPDDGIASFDPVGSKIRTLYYTTDTTPKIGLGSSVSLQEQAWDPNGYGPTPIFSTAGRILKADHDSLVTATRTGSPNDSGQVSINFLEEGHSTILPERLVPRVGSADFLSIAHGDLDGAYGSDGELHDEVVVGRVTGQSRADGVLYYRFQIDVLDYGEGRISSPAITSDSFADFAPVFQNSPSLSAGGVIPSDSIVSVAVGDFEGDGHKEIVLAALGDGTLLLYTYRYVTVNGEHSLRQLKSQFFIMGDGNFIPGQLTSRPLVGTIATSTGDFDGDGTDELAVSYARWGSDPSFSKQGIYGVGVLLFKYDRDSNAVAKNTSYVRSYTAVPSFPQYTRPRVELASAQFLLDPPAIHYGRRQLVMAWNSTDAINLQALSASTDLKSISELGALGRLPSTSNGMTQLYSIAAGGFAGASGDAPTASLGASYWDGTLTGQTSVFGIQTLYVKNNGITLADKKESSVGSGVDLRARLPLTAYDRPGNSRYLGAPVHMTILDAPETDYIMQEPPKHVYWDENKHGVVNLTRFDRNNVHMYEGSSASMSTTSTDESSRSTGGSISASASGTTTFGGNWGILSAEATVKADVQGKASYDYNEHEESFNSNYGERKIESSGQTDRDDYVKGKVQTIDVWRYRVYGAPKAGQSNGFYEIVLPGPEVPVEGAGKNFSWYQPLHENGNILSYPSRLGAAATPLIPTDLGPYALPNGAMQTAPQVPATLRYFDGTQGSTTLSYSKEVAQAGSFTFSHEIAESLDVKASYTAEAKTPLGSGSASVCGSIEVHNSNSWGGNKTSTSTTKDQTSITLNRASGVSSDAYPFYPVVYTAKDGTIKLSFSLPNPADSRLNQNGFQTYANLYGGLPDPALNLPDRFVPQSAGSGELEVWAPNQSIGRKKIRGLFFRHSERDSVDNTYLLFAFNPIDGETVRIEPRIYNYSTAKAAIGSVAQYEVIGYDSSVNSEICDAPINSGAGVTTGLVCPRSARQVIGKTTIPTLNPLQFTCVEGFDDPAVTGCAASAYLDWNTKGFGPEFGTNEYRVYVVLNPDQQGGPETYGSEPDPVQVTNVTNTSPMVVTAPGNKLSTGDYVVIGGVQGLDAANGAHRVTLVSDVTHEFSLDDTVVSRGGYTGGGTATQLDPGQNNEGYGTIGITRAQSLAAAPGVDRTPHDYLDADSLEALTETHTPRLLKSSITAIQNVPLELRFTVHSSIVHTEAAHMLLYDGDPATGVPAIADQEIHPGSHGRDGTSIWFNWTPATTGVHHLHAVLLEGSSTRQLASQLNVNVVAQP